MRIFKVDVLGLFKQPGSEEVKRAYLTFLIDAHSVHEAFEAGPLQAEYMAQMGPKWVSFETLVASPVQFPYMISDTTQRAVTEGASSE